MGVTTSKWDTSEYLDNPEMIREYLIAALEEGGPDLLVAAIGDVAKSKGMTQIAKETNLSRQNLYKALTENSSPKFNTVVKVLAAFDIKLSFEAA